MAERIADNADLAVDELKRRARRRLVGAVVLALAAAVILPLLLEKEPKPLGDDVSVQIPPVDEGRFINRLTGRESKNASKSDSKALPKAPPSKIDAAPAPVPAPTTRTPRGTALRKALPHPLPPRAPCPFRASRSPMPSSGCCRLRRSPLPRPKPSWGSSRRVMRRPRLRRRRYLPSSQRLPPATAHAKAEGFAVQIAAFTDDKGANALAGKLKKAGYASTYIEPAETSRGTLWRVRVGGFATHRKPSRAHEAQDGRVERTGRGCKVTQYALSARPTMPRFADPPMPYFDLIVVAVIVLSTLFAYVRGVVRELFAIASWVVGLVLALRYADPVASLFPPSTSRRPRAMHSPSR